VETGEKLDAHVHGYPKEVSVDSAAWARRHGERHWGRLVSEGPQGWADAEAMIAAMDDLGISKVWLQGWYWETAEAARRQNEWHAEWLDRYPDRFLASCALHPGMGDPVAALEDARAWGACGVGELLPQVQSRHGWEDPFWHEMLTWTQGQGWPVLLHVTEEAGHVYPGRVETPLMDLVELFETYAEQRWICAHWGGGLPFYSLNWRVHNALRNVWVDTAAGPLLYNSTIWPTVRDLLGAGKILAGSDFPLRLRPSRPAEEGWRSLWRQLEKAPFSRTEKTAVAGGNLRDLLGLREGPALKKKR